MKKVLSIIAVLFVLAIPAAAQVDFGVKAGVNLAGTPTNLENLRNVDGKAGFFVGPMVKVSVPIVGLGVEADVLYSQSNSEIEGQTIERKSIEIPIYLRYDLALPAVSKFIVPFVAVGPQFGFNIGSLDEAINNALGMNLGNYELKKSQASLNLGLGAKLLSHIQLHANYNIALGNTAEYSTLLDGVWNLATKTKTNTWQISVAYIF